MTLVWTNRAITQVAAPGIDDNDTTIPVTTGQGARFGSPTGGDYQVAFLLDSLSDPDAVWEVIHITGRSTDNLTVVRDIDGTNQSWPAGSYIVAGPDAETMEDIMAGLGGGGATVLDDLTDVDAATPADGDVLTWVDDDNEWQPVAPSGGGGGGSSVSLVRPTFVRMATDISENGDVTMGATPAAGNTLVWIASTWLSPTPNVGGSQAANTHRWQECVNVGGNAFDGIRVWWRKVVASDTTTIHAPYPTGSSGQNAVCFEYSGGGGPPMLFDWLYGNGDPRVLTGYVLNDYSLMVGMFANTSNSADNPTITGATATVTEDTRQTATTTNGSPRQINPFHCDCNRGAETITANYAAAQDTIAAAMVIPPALVYTGDAATVPIGGRILLEEKNLAGLTDVDFTTGFSDDYDEYILEIRNLIPNTDNTDIYCRLKTAGSFVTGSSYAWAADLHYGSGFSTDQGSDSDSKVIIAHQCGTGTGENAHVDLWLKNARNTTVYKMFRFQETVYTATPSAAETDGTGVLKATTAIEGIRFYMSSSTITSGTAKLWAIRKS